MLIKTFCENSLLMDYLIVLVHILHEIKKTKQALQKGLEVSKIMGFRIFSYPGRTLTIFQLIFVEN